MNTAPEDPHSTHAVLGRQRSESCEESRGATPGVPRLPWAPPLFSAASRALLRENMGSTSSNLSELYAQLGSQESARSVDRVSETSSLPNVCDSQAVTRLLNDPAGIPTDKHTD
eukprot:UN4315